MTINYNLRKYTKAELHKLWTLTYAGDVDAEEILPTRGGDLFVVPLGELFLVAAVLELVVALRLFLLLAELLHHRRLYLHLQD